VAFSPDGTRLATASFDGTAKVWDAIKGQDLFALEGHTGGVSGVAFSPDGTRLATGSGDQTAKVWDATSGKELLSLKGHTAPVYGVAFSPDGNRLATGSRNRTVKVWDANSGQELFALKGHTGEVFSVCFSPDGTRLATGSFDSSAKVWDARTGQELFTLKGHTDYVSSVCFSPDGNRLATGNYDRTAKVWDARSGQELFALKGHTDPVSSVAFSPDGQQVIGKADDGKALVWDVRTGKLVPNANLPPLARPSAVSPDGQLLALPSGNDVRLLSLRAPNAWELGGRMWNTRFDPFWHAAQAEGQRQANNHVAHAFHREQLLAAFPSRTEHVSALLNAWAEVVRLHPEQSRAWRHLVLAQLFDGQPAWALQTCKSMLQRFTIPGPLGQAVQGFRAAPHDALTAAVMARLLQKPALLGGAGEFDRLLTARTGVLHPDGLPEPLSWLPAVPESEPLTRAALLCRAGKHAEAVALLQPLKEPRAHLWRALAEHGRGDKAAAQKAFDEALAEMERLCPGDPKADATPLPWEHRAEYEILKREAQALLKPAP
jgi:WD40 repeat protein